MDTLPISQKNHMGGCPITLMRIAKTSDSSVESHTAHSRINICNFHGIAGLLFQRGNLGFSAAYSL